MIRFGTVRVRPDKKATRALGLPGMKKAVDDLARDIAAEARSIATAEAKDTGSYAGSFEVTTGKDKDRTVAAVINEDRAALIVEFGTRDRPGKNVLRRAGENIAGATKPLHKGRP